MYFAEMIDNNYIINIIIKSKYNAYNNIIKNIVNDIVIKFIK